MHRSLSRVVRITAGGLTLERLTFGTLAALAVSLGLGDIAQVTPADTLLVNGVHALLPAAVGLALIGAIRRRRHRHGQPSFPRPVLASIGVWLVVQLASAALAPSHRAEALGTLERPVMGVLLAWVVCDVCRSAARWRRLLHAMAVGGLAIGLIALAEATGAPVVQDWLAALQEGAVPIGDVPRVAATLSHPNEAAVLLELSLPLLVAWLWTTSSRWRTGLALATLGMLLALVLTFSRAGLAAGLTGLAVMGVSSLKHRQPRRLAVLGTAALIVPLALTWASLADPGLERRLTAGLDEASAAQPARTQFWSVALAMLRDHPWLGVGPDNFRWDFAAYAGVPADNLGIHAHNQYLESLADTGLPGLLSFAWWLVALLRVAVDRARATRPDWPYRAALLASLSAWLVHALVDDFERFWPASVAFWLLVGLSLGRAGAGAGAGPLARLPRLSVEEPEDQADDRDHDEQDQDAGRTAQRGSAAASAEAHHERTLSVGRSGRIKATRAVGRGPGQA